MKLVVLDIETTGLDPLEHDIVEIAWQPLHNLTRTIYPAHDIQAADPAAMRVNRYWERGLDTMPRASAAQWEMLKGDLDGATIIGANPTFDVMFLRTYVDPVWHYRLIDVEAMAFQALRLDHMPGLKEVTDLLSRRGYQGLHWSDHTAAGDVAAVRSVYEILRTM